METLAVSGIGKRNVALRLIGQVARVHGLSLYGMDADDWPPGRLEVAGFGRIAPVSSDDFATNYLAELEQAAAVAHMTLIDPEIVPLALMQECETPRSRWLQPVSSAAEVCEDKFEFNQLLESVGLPVVETFLEPPDSFPYIVKDRRGSAASGFQIVREEEPALLMPEDIVSAKIFQPLLRGAHYCVDAMYSLHSGELVSYCAKRVDSKSRGESYLLESVDPLPFRSIMERLGATIPLRGIVNVDVWSGERSGELMVMEVNCRIGGNYPASHYFGCDLLELLFCELVDGSEVCGVGPPSYRVGERVAKYFQFSTPF